MANDTDQNIPMTAGGCRWKPSAGGGTFPAADPGDSAVTGSWIYGAPVQNTGCAGSKTLPMPPDPEDPTIPAAGAPGPALPGGMEAAPMPRPGAGGGEVPGQHQQMRDPVPTAAPGRPGSAQGDYQASLRGLLDWHVGCPVAATFQVGSGQTVTWQGILHTVGSDYLVLYQPDDDRYISCDLYSLKFVQFRSMKGAPYCAASPRWQGT